MTSFIAQTFSLIPHLDNSLAAVLATSRSLMNCSITPVILSDDETWKALTNLFTSGKPKSIEVQENLLQLFVKFSDTMQFTRRFTFSYPMEDHFINDILEHLIKRKRYFTRTLAHISFPNTMSIPLVCDKLRNINSIDLCWVAQEFSEVHLRLVSLRLSRITKLDLSKVSESFKTDNETLAPVANLRLLEVLDISFSEVTNLHFLRGLASLHTLILQSVTTIGDEFFDFSVENNSNNNNDDDDEIEVTPALPALREINLRGSYGMSDSAVASLQRNTPHLQSLEMTASSLGQEAFEAISALQLLRNLNLIACTYIDSSAVKLLFSSLHCLEYFSVRNAPGIDDDSLLLISETCASIRCLCFGGCQAFTDVGFTHLTSLPHLEKLKIANNTNEHFTGNICDEQVNDNESRKTFTPSLTELELIGCNVTDTGITTILRGLSLKTLIVGSCDNIAGFGLDTAFATIQAAHSLLKLELYNCEKLCNVAFIRRLVSLQWLGLSQCTEIDFCTMRQHNEEFVTLLRSPTLEVLVLRRTMITDADILDLALSPVLIENLRLLDLCDCFDLTNVAIRKAVSELKSLRRLHLRNCLADEMPCPLTAADIEYISSRLPHLESFIH